MSTPYTPTPTSLPATLDLPEDAVDALVVESVNTNTAALADAVALAEANIDDAQAALKTGFARFAVETGANYLVDQWLAFTLQDGTTSPTRVPVGSGTHSGAGDGEYISLGSGAEVQGWWKISIEFMASTPGDAAIESMPIRLVRHDASTDPTVGATTLRDWYAFRYSDNDTFNTIIKGEYLLHVESPTTNVRLSMRNITTIKNFSTTMLPLVTIEQVSRDL